MVLTPELAAANFSAHFNALLAIDPVWAQERPTLPAPQYRPLALDDAASILLNNSESLERALGTAYVAYAWRTAQQSGTRTQDYSQLESAYARLTSGLNQPPDGARADLTYLSVLSQLAGRSTCVREFSLTATYSVPLQSSEVIVSMTAERPVADYDVILNPQNWSKVAPELFVEAYRMDNGSPADPTTNPTPRPEPLPGPPWRDNVFEHAQWSIEGTVFSRFRNVLDISYAEGVGSTYELYENLTQNVLGFSDEGGLDADSGSIKLEIPRIGWTTSTTSKKLRFKKPAELRDYLNWLNVPLISMMLLRSVVGNACIPVPGSK